MGNAIPPQAAQTLQKYRGGWLLCLDDKQRQRIRCFQRDDAAQPARDQRAEAAAQIQGLIEQLFRLQDLNKNGLLEEEELVKLNQKIAQLHYGKDSKEANRERVQERYVNHFREHLDADGKPVDLNRFKEYMARILDGIDKDPRVQEMTLEQWIVEAESGRAAFFCASMSSQSDFEFLKHMSFKESLVFGPQKPLTASHSTYQNGSTRLPTTASQRTGPAAMSSIPTQPTDETPKFSSPGSPASLHQSFGLERLPPEAGSTEIAHQSFGLERLPPEAGSIELGGSSMPCSLTSANSTSQPGRGVCLPPTAGFAMSGAGSPPAEEIMYSGSSFVPHPGLRASGYSSMEESFLPHPDNGRGSIASMSEQSVQDSFLPHPSNGRGSLASIPEQSLHSSLGSKAHPGAANPGAMQESSLAKGVSDKAFRTGDHLDVWSDSQQAWLPGSVLAAFDTETSVEGYKVPAGTVKVTSAAGVKWVLPEQRTKMLRQSSSSVVTKYQKGETLKVWSDSNRTWLDGVVEEAYSTASAGNGFNIPAGTLRVKSSTGTSKWILPENIDTALRPGDFCKPAGAVADFTQGEKILVWSERKQDWLLGVVQRFFPEACSAEGFDVPAGSVKVMSATGEKWVLPKDRDRLLRKVEAGHEPDLKDMLGSILQRPTALHRQAEVIWTSALQPGERALPVERAAWALEGLASQFGVQVELEGSYAEAVRQKAESISRGQKSLAVDQFEDLCREIMSEVHAKM
eukprot:TRINITY_DN45327_c0_g1_i1.p1 TRINITY_DN45327_c0_g1~~TRINITY_DN45327_c0_g1_i1.p1  ORF type:complete len:750 (+),score=152.06 TRINITY_DN45327_c0_g1_i1:26-2251(+)